LALEPLEVGKISKQHHSFIHVTYLHVNVYFFNHQTKNFNNKYNMLSFARKLVTQPAARAMAPASSRWFAAQAFLPVEEVTERVFTVIKANEKVDGGKVNEAAHYVNDLGLDSLDHVEVLMAIEEEFAIEIPDAEAEKILTCADTISFITSHPQAK